MEKINHKVLAFDLGNVVFDFDYTIALGKIKSKMKASEDEVIKALYIDDFALAFEKGLVSEREFYLEFKKAFSLSSDYKEFVDVWCKIFFPKPEVIDWIKYLKPKYPLYLISNINKMHFDYLYKKYKPVFSLFDDLILSFRLKAVKPEETIYQALKTAAGGAFKNIIYIDR